MILTDTKIKWIVKQKSRGRLSTNQIALLQHISESRVRQLWSEYKKTGKMPTLKKAGRPKRVVTEDEEKEIISLYIKYPTNAVALEYMFKKKGINLEHNLIHTVLKKHRLAADQKGKWHRKKWIRYEREYSNSLWHVDWHMIKDQRWKGLWLIVYEDDSSRFITGYGVYPSPTSKYSVDVLKKAIE
ncbi:MAG: IS481 family transposase, partial [Nitrososphaeria archaeon]